jgi:hypothetical protein
VLLPERYLMPHLYALGLLGLISFAQVFAMAFQSKSINGGHYAYAAFGSIAIGASQAFIWNAVVGASAGVAEIAVYSICGGLGCLAAMYMHSRYVRKR